MGALSVSENKRMFLRNGKPFLWFGDTCWSAFTNATDEEWDAYLDYRAKQGFNILQINALPQWDRCKVNGSLYPFPVDETLHFDYSRINDAYFEHAARMCAKATEHGFIPAIVVMWCNYVPGTWASGVDPNFIMPEAYVPAVVKKIADTFNPFDPVYLISGDTDWKSDETIARYRLVSDLMEEYAPDTLKCYHLAGFSDELPEEMERHADMYIFQSGHNPEQHGCAVTLSQSFYRRTPTKPVINSEPCYEQMGFGPAGFGRFRRDAVRSAFWNSLLSGASAGITYGANGVWNWQSDNMLEASAAEDVFLRGFCSLEAMKLPGAKDYAFGIGLLKERGLYELTPAQEILTAHKETIRAARSGKTVLIYNPANTILTLNGTYGKTAVVYDLETGASTVLPVACSNGQSVIGLHPYYADVLMVLNDAE